MTLHPIADFFFRIILWITTGQDRRQWVAVHRKHHAFTDTEKDPHSPLVHGFWKIQLWNVYYYIREARNAETLARWAKDIREDWWDKRIFSKGTLGGILGIGPDQAAEDHHHEGPDVVGAEAGRRETRAFARRHRTRSRSVPEARRRAVIHHEKRLLQSGGHGDASHSGRSCTGQTDG